MSVESVINELIKKDDYLLTKSVLDKEYLNLIIMNTSTIMIMKKSVTEFMRRRMRLLT